MTLMADPMPTGKLETYGCDGFRLPMSGVDKRRAPQRRQIVLLDAGALPTLHDRYGTSLERISKRTKGMAETELT